VRLFDLFDSEGIALVFLDMNIDIATSQGRLLRHAMAAFAEYESTVKSDYAWASYRHAMSQGRAWGGRPSFGYDRDSITKSYVINPERAEIVRETFARYRRGESQHEISKVLNAAAPSPRVVLKGAEPTTKGLKSTGPPLRLQGDYAKPSR